MKFEPIKEISLPLGKTECFDRLVNDFGIKSYAWHRPKHLSELERLLVHGMSKQRRFDFTNKRGTDLWCGEFLGVFDHDYLFRCELGITFSLTMPYNTHEGFYQDFGDMMREYYAEKSSHAALAQRYPHSAYSTNKGWESQFAIDQTLVALIIDDKYKIRENGNFAAIIATEETLETLRWFMR